MIIVIRVIRVIQITKDKGRDNIANNVRKDERSSISISKETRDRFMTHLADLIGEAKQVITQDEAVNILLTCSEQALRKSRELQGSFDPHGDEARRRQFVEQHRDEIGE
jgi:hypothetical protein